MNNKFSFLLIVSLLCLASCKMNTANDSIFADSSMWCCLPSETDEAVDVFYIVSTNIMQSFNPDGTESCTAVLNDEEKALLSKEINYIHESMFPAGVNFFSPYYHQMTMSAQSKENVSREEKVEMAKKTSQEVIEAFNYYLENYNQGRPFIIAGYSQGALMTRIVLCQLTETQRHQLVAAYMMGFGLDAETLKNPNVKAAEGADDTGVTISFTSVANPEAIYDPLVHNVAACINPISWSTESTPASIDFDGETLTAQVDPENKVLIVDGFHYENHQTQQWSINPWSKDNYHNFEIYFYAPSIRQNALDRIDSFLKQK